MAWHASAERRAGVRRDVDGRRRDVRAGAADRPERCRQPARPRLAATAGGRVDAAYLWDTGSGAWRATAASAGPPLAGATTEAWAQPVVVQAAAAGDGDADRRPERPARPGPRRRDRGGDHAVEPAAPTVVAYTDTPAAPGRARRGLLHGTTAPVIARPDGTGIQGHDDDRARGRQRRRRRPADMVDGAQPSNPPRA